MRRGVRDRIMVERESPDLLHELGYSYASQKNVAVAIATLEDNLARYTTFYLSHFPLAQVYCDQRRDVAKGRTHLEAFIKQAEADRRAPELHAPLVSYPKLEASILDARKLLQTCGR